MYIYPDNIVFIDSLKYNTIFGKDITSEVFIDELNKNHSLISVETKKEIYYLTYKLQKGLFRYELYNTFNIYGGYDSREINYNKELKYLEKNYRYKYIDSDYLYCVEKYYEFKLLPNNYILIIIEDNFIKKITESKVELIKFFLNLLCFLNQYNINNSFILERLIAFKIYDFNFITLKNNLL